MICGPPRPKYAGLHPSTYLQHDCSSRTSYGGGLKAQNVTYDGFESSCCSTSTTKVHEH